MPLECPVWNATWVITTPTAAHARMPSTAGRKLRVPPTADSVTSTSLHGTAKVSANRVVSPRVAGSEAPAPRYAWTLNSAVRVERVCLHWPLVAVAAGGAAFRLGRRTRV